MENNLINELNEYQTLMRIPGCLILLRTELSLQTIDELQTKLNIFRDEIIEELIERELKNEL